MTSPVSRRTFLTGFGGGLASAAVLAWGLRAFYPWRRLNRYPLPECCSYVEYGGWILTKADKDRLTAAGSIRLLDSTSLEGQNLADRVEADVDSCKAWCLGEPDCQGFTYGKATHPDPNMQRRCWLKSTSQLSPMPDPRFTSGLR